MSKLTFKTLWLKNFLSFGKREVAIPLEGNYITVILGENLDTGGEDSRNGVGKSAMIDGICYALFGKVIREISNQKLIHKYARKGQSMQVGLEFDKGEWSYLIERGERPGRLQLFRKPIDSKEGFKVREGRKFKYDISRSSKTETNDYIVGVLGFNITLFEYIVANSSESEDFLKLREERKRDVGENLFGFTIMTEKAKMLKEKRKDIKKDLAVAESTVEATRQANKRIFTEIEDLEKRSKVWEEKNVETITELQETIQYLETVDVEQEISLLKLSEELHKELSDVQSNLREKRSERKNLESAYHTTKKELTRYENQLEEAIKTLEELDKGTCPTCGQHWEPNPECRKEFEDKKAEAEKGINEASESIQNSSDSIKELQTVIETYENRVAEIEESITEIKETELTYESVEEAASASATLKSLKEQLETAKQETNPYTESIDGLRNKAVKKIDDSEIKSLRKLVKHYDFLIELLMNKDSFLRKLIIDRWLPKLNQRIAYWLNVLELPHQVVFESDMTLTITDFHEEYDYGNLSRGERNRLRVALNFAFQEIFEYMNYRINLLCIDELIDSGICPRGAENTVSALREICAKKDKRVFLITHRDDIAARVEDVVKVIKENRISRIEKAA